MQMHTAAKADNTPPHPDRINVNRTEAIFFRRNGARFGAFCTTMRTLRLSPLLLILKSLQSLYIECNDCSFSTRLVVVLAALCHTLLTYDISFDICARIQRQ